MKVTQSSINAARPQIIARDTARMRQAYISKYKIDPERQLGKFRDLGDGEQVDYSTVDMINQPPQNDNDYTGE